MNKKITLTLFILLLTIGSSYSQSNFRRGFIITSKKDTIQGQVDYRSNSKNYKSCIFKSEQLEKEYDPNQILGFGYTDDKFFTSQIIEGSFVEALIIGEISLYRSLDKYHIKKDTAIFDIESMIEEVNIDGKVRQMDKGKWRGVLIYLTSDCSTNLRSLIAELKLEEKSLTRFVIKYHKCIGAEFTEFKADIPWTQFDFGTTIGLSRSDIQIDDYAESFPYLDNSYTSIDPFIGLILNISFPRISERIALQGEVHFMKSSYSALVKLEGSSTQYHDTFIDLSTLSIPLSMKYSFPEKRFGLYLQAGLNYDHHLNASTRLLTEQAYGNVVNTYPERAAFELSNNQFGYWGGIGLHKSYEKFRGGVTIRYVQMSTLNRTEDLFANNNKVSLSIILFKK
ncbi:MAG: hypothetical protein ACJA2S_005148 [Cyclobacteriaceae bacterium]|jgi:hypothetical protein